MTRNEYESGEIIENMTMCPPGVRTVIVHGWCDYEHDPDQIGHTVYPVVAIRSFVRHTYRSRREGDRHRRRGRTHAEMAKLGWTPELLPELVTEAIYVDQEFGLIGNMDDLVCMDHGSNQRIALCPWPPEEDDVRLAETIRRVREAAINQCRKRTASVVAS